MHTTFVGVIRTFLCFLCHSLLNEFQAYGFIFFGFSKLCVGKAWHLLPGGRWAVTILLGLLASQISWMCRHICPTELMVFLFSLNLALLLEDESMQWGMNRAGLHAYVQQFPRPSNDAPPVQPNRKCLWRVYHLLLLKSVGCIVSEKNLSDSLLFFEEFTD